MCEQAIEYDCSAWFYDIASELWWLWAIFQWCARNRKLVTSCLNQVKAAYFNLIRKSNFYDGILRNGSTRLDRHSVLNILFTSHERNWNYFCEQKARWSWWERCWSTRLNHLIVNGYRNVYWRTLSYGVRISDSQWCQLQFYDSAWSYSMFGEILDRQTILLQVNLTIVVFTDFDSRALHCAWSITDRLVSSCIGLKLNNEAHPDF